MYRIDLHTHSIISYDGGITAEQYRELLMDQQKYFAITDHNEISLALDLHQGFGQQVIVGEEILTLDGEVIGLFLAQLIPAHLSLPETINEIRRQNGLVYIPHPFEKTRKGLSMEALEKIAGQIDILEVFNARSKEPWLAKKAWEFASKHNLAQAASSDAHSVSGLGTAFSELSEFPSRENLI